MEFEFWSYYIIFAADILFIFFLAAVIVCGSILGVAIKIGLVLLKKENRVEFINIIAVPEQFIQQFIVEKEEGK
jgi:hypothetical protein